MAKAKKKLNTKFLTTAASIAVALGVAGAGGGYMIYRAKRPDQLKAEGRELMDQGKYDEAFKRFSRAGSRKSTDPEFLTWMQETESHLSSFDPVHYRASYMLLGAIINASSDKFPPTLKKAQADLIDLDTALIDQMSQERLRDLESTAKTLLEREPKNPTAYRLRAYAKIAPIFAAGSTPGSEEVQVLVDQLKQMMEEVPTEPDLIHRYVQALAKHREAQVREMTISDSPTSEQALTLYREYRRLNDIYQGIVKNEALPAEDRARASARNYEMLQYILGFRLVPRDEIESFLVPALTETVAKASTLIPVTSPYYINFRLRHAGFYTTLKSKKNYEEAEKILRETMEAQPKQWQPRLALANTLSELNRPLEAVELLSADLKPSYDLVGQTGSQFYYDSEALPLRRAYFRLQSLAQLPPEKRDAEIARIEEDYKSAISKPTIGGESNPYALQVQAGLQEIRQDRTGALQTLKTALDKVSNTPQYGQLRIKILEQLMRLNDYLNQTGQAEEYASMLYNAQPGDFPRMLQVIDFKIRNGKRVEAQKMLDVAKVQYPDQPALAAISIRLLPDEDAKRKELDKIPEKGDTLDKTRDLVMIKMKLAHDAEVEAAVGEIAERFLKDNVDDYRVTLMYVHSLVRQEKKAEALRRVAALRAKDPSNPDLVNAEEIIKAESPEQLQQIYEREYAKNSPLNAKLIEAQKALTAGDEEGFIRLMREAEPLDTTGSVTERIFRSLMGAGKLDEAEAELNKLAKMGRDPAEVRSNRLRINLARATILQMSGKADEASKIFDQASEEANKMVAEMPQFSGAWIVKGLTHNARGQLDDALDSFCSAFEAQRNNPETIHYILELALQTNQGDRMKKYLDLAKEITPGDPYLKEATLRYDLAFGDPEKAIEPRIKQRDEAPDQEVTWLNLGQTYMTAAKKATEGKAAEYRKLAIDTFTQAMAKFPGSPGFGLAAANVMVDSGDKAGATKIIEELAGNAKNAEEPGFLAALSNYYVQTKDLPKALAVMQKLLDTGKAGDPNQLRASIAQIHSELGQIDQALAAAEAMPDSQASRELRVNLLLTGRRFEDANRLANSFLEKEKSVNNLLMASHTEAQLKNQMRSIELATQAVALDPNNANTHLYRAKAMMREVPPRNTEILEALETVKKLAPKNAEARLLAADRLAAMSRTDEAVSELESVVRDLPGNREATVRLIQAYLAQKPVPFGRIDSIFEQLRRDKQMDVGLLSLETNIALQRGDVQRAVLAAKEAAETDLTNIGLYRQLVDVMIRAEQYKEVLADLDRIQSKNQNVYWTYMVRGIALHRQNKETEAKKNWDMALNMVMSLKDDSPTGEVVQKYAKEYGAEATGKWLNAKMGNEPRMRALMVNIYESDRQPQKVIELGETLMPLPQELNLETQKMVLNAVGSAYLSVTPSRPEKARELFEQLVKIDADNAYAWNNAAYAILLEGSDITKGTEYAKRAYDLSVKLGKPDAYIVDTYGWALVRNGKVQEGIDVLREAATIQEIPDVAYHLGEAYLLENQKDAALQSLQKALELIPIVIKNGGSVDSGLEPRIKDALTRASM